MEEGRKAVSVNKYKCPRCYGYGLWGIGSPVPMGPLDVQDGEPTIACPSCGANANPSESTFQQIREESPMSKPPAFPLNLTDLQGEVRAWTEKNFQNRKNHQPLLGICEEVGELCHAQLKGEQGIRHTPEEIRGLKCDAIGDIVIYLVDYCNIQGIDLEQAIWNAWYEEVSRRDWTKPNTKDPVAGG